MKRPRRQTLWIAAIFAAVFVALLLLSERPISYANLMNEDPKYYVVLANACETIFRATPPDSAMLTIISGNEKFVPAVVKDLKPSQIEVASGLHDGTNTISRLRLVLGGKNKFVLAWEPNAKDAAIWELAVTGDDGRVVLFAGRKASTPVQP